MSRRMIVIASVVVAAIAAAIVAVAVIPPLFSHSPAVEAGALGAWRTADPGRTYQLTVARDTRSTGRVWYSVVFTRDSRLPSSASLDGDKIVVWGENAMSDPRWDITYNAATDELTLAQPRGHETYTLRRVAAP